jgi:hypothetical protein
MTTLSKDQVRKLTPEQQEALGAAEVHRIRSRQQLLERGRRGMSPAAGLLTGLALGLAGLCIAIPRALPFAIIAVIGLVTFHATRLYRRLDALTELLDATDRSDDDTAAS